uniref:DsbD n=1 Tax=Pterocladia lucida TaxID=31408 RepID=A0A6M3WVK8_PTELU|nr:dsbD [Pterocladia lucida]
MTNLLYLQIKFYYFEQLICKIISLELHSLTPLISILFIISGVLTSINPCFITIIPLSISYISSQQNRTIKLVYFLIGLITSLIILTLSIYYLNHQLNWIIKSLPALSSILTVILGLFLLEIYSIKTLPTTIQNIININENHGINDIIMGIIIGLASTPCSTPIMTTILFWISHSSQFTLGLIYISFYIIGLVIPIIAIINLTINYKELDFLNLIWNKVIPLGGSIILGIGIFSFLNKVLI